MFYAQLSDPIFINVALAGRNGKRFTSFKCQKKVCTYPNGFGTIFAILMLLVSHLFLHFLQEALPPFAFSIKKGFSDSSESDITKNKQ